MATYTQDNRLIQVTTALGKDVLLLQSFSGEEGISRLFRFDLRMQSENRSIPFASIVGKKATIKVLLPDNSVRHINGIISSFVQGGTSTLEVGESLTATFTSYHATLVPWLWFLTRTSDCRIFQDETVPEIITKIFQENGLFDFEERFHKKDECFKKREYCVQYRETDFNFVSRLMEEEGIFYFFEHEETKHRLVLADHPNAFKPCALHPVVSYRSVTGEDRDEDVITEWSIGQEVRPGKYELRDFNFEQPSNDLTAGVTGKDEREYQIYDYPGKYLKRDLGERLVGLRMEEQETSLIEVAGSGTCRGFTPGYRFDLKDHYRRDLDKAYVLTSVYHSSDQGTNYRSSQVEAAQRLEYVNQFQCTPHPSPFRPPRTTPAPIVQGTQTAIVVGPEGEEIHTDNYGRVKVKFHWDREHPKAPYDENSSCWSRVSQPWAGGGWGSVSIPRIGQEVVVDFLEGDPDRPIIIGRVYNAKQMPPYELPSGGVVSGLKSNTHKGKGYNEISMNDTAKKEMITVHAQYDMATTVEHDDTQTIHNNRTIQVDGTHTETIVKDTTITITEGNLNHSVVKGTGTYYVKGAVDETYDDTQKTHVANNVEITSKNLQIILTAKTEILLICGASMLSMKEDGTIVLSGKDISVSATDIAKLGVGNQNITCDKTLTATSGAAINSSATGKHEITGAVVKIN